MDQWLVEEPPILLNAKFIDEVDEDEGSVTVHPIVTTSSSDFKRTGAMATILKHHNAWGCGSIGRDCVILA